MRGGDREPRRRANDDRREHSGRGGGKPREVEPSINLPHALWRKDGFRAGRERFDMATFVKAAAACDIELNEFILQTGNSPAVMDKFHQILSFGFNVKNRTFQEIALPLMALVTSAKFTMSPHTTDVKQILRAIHSHPLFFVRVRNCIQCETAALVTSGHFDQAVTNFAALLSVIVQKIPKAAVDDDMFDLATAFLAWLLENETNGTGPARKSLRDTLEVCMELVPSRRPMDREAARPNYLVAGVQTLHGRKKLADTSGDRAFDLGPRHDNDDADFREVKVIPTDLEMRCLEPSYLPHQLPPNAGMEAHLELHFRLLREDVLAQIKRGVQWLFAPQTLRRCVETQNWTPPREQNVPRFNVALNVRLAQVKGNIHKGIMFVIKADQPTFRKGATSKDLKAFWEREQRYQVGSLVCIACDVQLQLDVDDEGGSVDGAFPRYIDLAAQELIFATVCENNIADFTSSTEFFSVSLKLIDTAKTADHIALLTKQHHQNVLIEVRGLFFPAYEPILHALQALNTRSLSEELQQGLFGDVAQQSWKAKPPYAAEVPTYNLQFLVKKDCGRRVDLTSVPIDDFEQLAGFLRPYEQQGCLTLDGSQVEAFAAALTQQVCLIQGPPGTGKSYVGTKIVRAILEQRRLAVGPILCVCYTNHALDQFLEDLVKDGLPVTSIVRMGGRSKSEMFQDRSLHVINKDTLSSRQENQRFGALKRQCGDMDEFLGSLVNEKSTSGGPPKASFFQWVEMRYPDEYAEIVGSEDDDGFAEQGQGKKDRATRWKAWERGATRLSYGEMWAMSVHRRQSLVAAWQDEWEDVVKKNMATNLDQFNECVAQAEEVNNARSLRVLQAAKIVGITTTGAAKYHALLRALAPKVVVCEEAGEVLEAHLLSCLTPATQQLIQIGDHMQLRPILNEYTLSYEAKRGYNLDVSMFERLVGERTDEDSGRAKVPGSLVTLHVQRRMRPEICDLIRFTLYPALCDGPQVLAYPDTTRGFTDNLWFLDHDQPENSGDLSCKNAFEAALVVELVAHAIRQGYGLDDITILTPYLGQLVLIRQLLQGKNFRVALEDKDVEAIRLADMEDEEEEDDEDAEQKAATPTNVAVKSLREFVRLSTVDNFQGNESTLVFISTVRSNDSGRTGFLKTFNRVNVMLSRAKAAMYVLGSAATIRRSAKATMFNGVLDILEDKGRVGRTLGLRCQKHGTITQIASASDIQRLSPDGGCLVPCDRRLNCGHSCPKACHADDPRHVAAKCMEPCVKRVAACGHLCTARCYEVCSCSKVIDRVELDCGHARRNVRCADVHGSIPLRCTTKVTVSMPFCRHPRTESCAFARRLQRALDENDEEELWKINLKCGAPCASLRPKCGHACEQPCRGCLEVRLPAAAATATLADMKAAAAASTTHMTVCPHKCDRPLFCGHNCTSPCHPAGTCPPCDAPCRNLCTHSGCPRQCKDPCASCADPCTWHCPHMNETCKLPCGSPCTRLPCDLRCTNDLSCGHQCPGLCGEPCLSSAFCRQCPPRVATERSQVVDLIMGTTLQDHDPDESPLVRLRCGHCFTIETMDGCLELAKFYETDGQGQWVGVKPLEPPAQGGARYTCPTCRAPVGGVRRYGRLVNFSQLMVSELKYLQATTAEIALSKALRTTAKQAALSDVKAYAGRFRELVAAESPSQEVCTKESSRLARLGFTGDSLNLNAFRHVMSSQPRIMLSLELMELLALLVQTMDKASKGKTLSAQIRAIYAEGLKLEKSLREMCRRDAAHRSANEAVLAGMKLRVAYQQQAVANSIKNFSKEAIVRELRDSLGVLTASTHPVPPTMVEHARHLVKSAEEFGKLTKAEKDAIFKVFATSTDVFAQGFGGHWYQCPSGHPYVITECGGAMQEATCPECGAAIGGSSHQLNATNTTAEQFFAR